MAEKWSCTIQYDNECTSKHIKPRTLSCMIKSVGDRELRHVSSLQVWNVHFFPVFGLTPIPNIMQQNMTYTMRLKHATMQCNKISMQTTCNGQACKHAINILAYTMLWTTWHTQCSWQLPYTMQMVTSITWHEQMQWSIMRQHGILNAMNYMAYSMHNGLKPKWIGLSHVQISGHNDETKAQKTRHACTMHWPHK